MDKTEYVKGIKREMNSFDNWVYEFLNSFNSEALTIIMVIITNLAHAITFIGITVLILIFVKNKIIKKYVVVNLIAVVAINQALKYIIGRPRPEVTRLVSAHGYSFPSGHSMTVFAYYGFLIYLIYKHVKNIKVKIGLIILLVCIILFVGVSRIYLGVHYATDVIGGFLISAVLVTGAILLYNKEEKTKIGKDKVKNKKMEIEEQK